MASSRAGIGDGAVFRPVSRYGRIGTGRLTAQTVALVVKRAATAAGLDPARLAGHSLRSGFATSAAIAGGVSKAECAFEFEMDVSRLDEMPPGRQPIDTRVVAVERMEDVVGALARHLESGQQAYWVCPLIEESEALQLQTAVESYEQLTQALPGFKVGLVHGRLKAEEKAAVMAAFKANEIQLLVATTVIEVGVDVPNAALMVIEHAERFGYAQIHQLRGRVGRGSADSVCILMYAEPLSMAAKERLQTLRETSDGFVIAERDLSLRGPGELLGAKQSGDAMLRFVDLQRDAWLIELAQTAAERLLAEHGDLVERHLERWLGSRTEFLKA